MLFLNYGLIPYQRSRRLWLIDRHAAAIGQELRDDLGDWIKRRLRQGVTGQGDKAKGVLKECGVGLEELRRQWENQQLSQLSIRARMFLWTFLVALRFC